MPSTPVLIIGASVSGLSVAAALQRQGIAYTIIEKESQVATPWRNHYQRLHLHTNKALSGLPYKKFDSHLPRYPSRQQVVDYLDDYQNSFNIQPVFNTAASSIKREQGQWNVTTNNGVFAASFVVVATGVFNQPRPIAFPGMDSFPGQILHSAQYQTGKDFTVKEVLVVGFGNSACEIAIDLVEQGAAASMAVRSPVNVVPRDIFGLPVVGISVAMSVLPVKIADAINAPLIRLLVGDIKKLGLQRLPYGPLEQIEKYAAAPLLDIGTIDHIRKGHIKIYPGIEKIDGSMVHFNNGKTARFDAIVAAIGYSQGYESIGNIAPERLADLKHPIDKQQYFGRDGLYFCGFWIAPTGQFREIARDAKKIGKDIAQNIAV